MRRILDNKHTMTILIKDNNISNRISRDNKMIKRRIVIQIIL
jgi:hypothetical protein